MLVTELWLESRGAIWQRVLAAYDAVIAAQGVARLQELEHWYREVLPLGLASRVPAHASHEELVTLTEWKMARGIWRPRNLALVRGNPPAAVQQVSERALAAMPHPSQPVAELCRLAGVGPATASALLAAAAPGIYPFLDEIVAAQVPGLGQASFTPKYYAEYSERLRGRAAELGGEWTPVDVERALWANAGGKAGTGVAGSASRKKRSPPPKSA